MVIAEATLSARSMRRSRSPALALARESGPPLDRKVDPTPGRARIEVWCPHQLLGIAPQKLLFHAGVKNEAISALLTIERDHSVVLARAGEVCVRRMMNIVRQNSARDVKLPPRRQKVATSTALKSPFVGKAGR